MRQPTLIEMLEAPDGVWHGPTLRREAAVALREAQGKATTDADALRAEVKRLRDALDPDLTKAAYIGEVTTAHRVQREDEDGDWVEASYDVPISWTATKEVMAIITARAAIAEVQP